VVNSANKKLTKEGGKDMAKKAAPKGQKGAKSPGKKGGGGKKK